MWAYRKCHRGIVTFLIDSTVGLVYGFRNTSLGIDNGTYAIIMICLILIHIIRDKRKDFWNCTQFVN